MIFHPSAAVLTTIVFVAAAKISIDDRFLFTINFKASTEPIVNFECQSGQVFETPSERVFKLFAVPHSSCSFSSGLNRVFKFSLPSKILPEFTLCLERDCGDLVVHREFYSGSWVLIMGSVMVIAGSMFVIRKSHTPHTVAEIANYTPVTAELQFRGPRPRIRRSCNGRINPEVVRQLALRSDVSVVIIKENLE